MIQYLLFILLAMHGQLALGDWSVESKKINYLLTALEKSNAVFIRNGKEYTSKEAAAHMKMKLEKAQTSWFSPGKEKWTAKMFISKIASTSSMSGEPYLIKEKDKAPEKAEDWLTLRLTEYEKSNPASLKTGSDSRNGAIREAVASI